ncbi:MAG TPA: hypothetical protein VLH60_05325 [Sedimentisphaerales bacterium]|nr:hypothetical protein [Sedimentisphaerales bacterium]
MSKWVVSRVVDTFPAGATQRRPPTKPDVPAIAYPQRFFRTSTIVHCPSPYSRPPRFSAATGIFIDLLV